MKVLKNHENQKEMMHDHPGKKIGAIYFMHDGFVLYQFVEVKLEIACRRNKILFASGVPPR